MILVIDWSQLFEGKQPKNYKEESGPDCFEINREVRIMKASEVNRSRERDHKEDANFGN